MGVGTEIAMMVVSGKPDRKNEARTRWGIVWYDEKEGEEGEEEEDEEEKMKRER